MNDYLNFYHGNIQKTDTNKLFEEIMKLGDDRKVFLTLPELRFFDEKLKTLSINDRIKLKEKLKNMFLYLSYPTELSYDEYKKLKRKYSFYHIFVDGLSSESGNRSKFEKKTTDIDPEIMELYLKKLKELIRGLPMYSPNNYEENVKTICILANRIVENVFYDIKTVFDNNSENYNSRYNVPNEMVGLIDRKAVCRGFAGIFRDTGSLLGYEIRNINGFNEENVGHEWNQIKIGENWYCCDITLDRLFILHQQIPLFLLTSHDDFYRLHKTQDGQIVSHGQFVFDQNQTEYNAKTSVPRELIKKYLYIEEQKKENWLKSFLNINREMEGDSR